MTFLLNNDNYNNVMLLRDVLYSHIWDLPYLVDHVRGRVSEVYREEQTD